MSYYIISPSASQDLNAIADYFLAQNIEKGESLLREFSKKCQKLVIFPNLGKSYAHLRPGLRGFPLDGYIVFYQIIDNRVEILRVVSGRRDLGRLFADDEESKD